MTYYLDDPFIISCHLIEWNYSPRESAKELPKQSTASVHAAAVSRAKLYMHENFHHDLKLQQIASQACISPYHFCRLFKKLSQCSPHSYLLALRLAHAEHLLKNSGLPITDVCYQSGFTRLDYFCSVFSKHYGISPLKFRLREMMLRQEANS